MVDCSLLTDDASLSMLKGLCRINQQALQL